MGLKAVVDDIGTIDENLRPLYVERGGRHVLDVERVGDFALEDVGSLSRGHARSKEELRTLKEEIGDLKPSEARAAMQKLAELQQIDPTKESDRLAAEKFSALEKQLKAQFDKEKLPMEQELLQLRSENSQLTVRSSARVALVKAGAIDDDGLDLLVDRVAGQTRSRMDSGKRLVEILDKDGNPRIGDSNGNPYTFDQLASEFMERYPRQFKGTESTGSGATQSASTASMGSGRLTPEQADSLAQNDPSGYAKARQEGRL